MALEQHRQSRGVVVVVVGNKDRVDGLYGASDFIEGACQRTGVFARVDQNAGVGGLNLGGVAR